MYGKRVREQMNERKDLEVIEEKRKKDNGKLSTPPDGEKVVNEDHKTRLERLIPEFYINQKTMSDDSAEEVDKDVVESDASSDLSELKEDQKADLFCRLKTRTKTNFFITKDKSFDNSEKNNFILPFLPTSKNIIDNNKTRSNSHNSQTITERKIDGLGVKNAAASNIYRSSTKNETLVDNNPTILNIKKLREKFEVISEQSGKKDKILGVDLFKYDNLLLSFVVLWQ